MAEIGLSMRASVSRKRLSVSRSRVGGLVDEGVEVGGDRVDASGQLVELPLSVAPEAAKFLAVLAALFGHARSDTLDACAAFVYGHALSIRMSMGWECQAPINFAEARSPDRIRTSCATLVSARRRQAGDKERANCQVLVDQWPVDAIAGRREFRAASFRGGCTSETIGTVFPGDRDRPSFRGHNQRLGFSLDGFRQNRFCLTWHDALRSVHAKLQRSGRNAER